MILHIHFPVREEATINDFADDLAVLVRAKNIEDVQFYATETERSVKSLLERAGLILTNEKTEVVLIANHSRSLNWCNAAPKLFSSKLKLAELFVDSF